MKIGILNESYLSEQNINELKSIGEVEIYPETNTEKDAIDRIKDKEVIIVDIFVCPLTNSILEKAKNLKLIAINSTGYDKIDLYYLKKRGITLCNCPGFSTDSVAEQVFALILATIRRLIIGDRDFRRKPFETLPGFNDHEIYRGFNLKGKTLGVIGAGSIGRRVLEIGRGFGMNLIFYNRTKKQIVGAEQRSLDEILIKSDIVSINLPMSDETKNLINKEKLKLMKKSSILINTSRGKIVNTNDLYKSLLNKEIFGAGLDVIDSIDDNKDLLQLDNVVFSPHSAWFTKESLDNLGKIVTDNILSFFKGNGKSIIV